jgi:N-acetylglucosaminyl-diphospho-decaprenol L-rhamnosyltransferase
VRLSIDVAVVAFNRYDLTESCLRHLREQTREHRVLLCDNGSADGTYERVGREWPEVVRTRTEDNRGFPEACNRAVALGDGDVVVLLNNDVDCEPAFLERLIAPLDADPSLGSAAALCVRPGGENIDSMGMTTDATLSPFPRLRGLPVARAGSERPVLIGPAGTAGAYRRSAWEQLGGLDEHIIAYGEDFDLATRLRAHGWGTVGVPEAVGVHLGSATFGHRSAFQRRYGGFSRAYLIRRYGLLRRRGAVRTAFTEALSVAGDAVVSRDFAALSGRVAGWRAATGLPRHPMPPAAAIDHSVGLREAIDLRRGVYEGYARGDG